MRKVYTYSIHKAFKRPTATNNDIRTHSHRHRHIPKPDKDSTTLFSSQAKSQNCIRNTLKLLSKYLHVSMWNIVGVYSGTAANGSSGREIEKQRQRVSKTGART